MNWNEVNDAIAGRDIQKLRSLLSGLKGPSRNQYFFEWGGVVRSRPFLHFAASASQNATEMMKILVEAGMDVNIQDHRGRTALHVTVEKLQCDNKDTTIRKVTTLLQLGCNPMVKDGNGRTILHILTRKEFPYDLNGFIDVLIPYIEESKRTSFVNTTDINGRSAISYAIDNCFSPTRMINQLLDLKGDPFVGDTTTGPSILHMLLSRLCGADRNDDVSDDEDDSSIDNEDDTLLTIVRLLGLGCDPVTQDQRGQTSLHILMRNGAEYDFSRVFQALLAFVDESNRISYLNAKDAQGRSAIFYVADWYYSSTRSRMERLRILSQAGADVNMVDDNGRTVLHVAVSSILRSADSVKLVRALVRAGVDGNLQDESGQTALHIALTMKDRFAYRVIKILLKDDRMNINLADREGRTPLHVAVASNGHCTVDSVLLLLKSGAERNRQDRHGQTALHLLSKKSNSSSKSKIVSLLLQHGSDPTIPDSEGYLPLNYLGDPNTFDSTAAFLLLQQMGDIQY